MPEPLDSPIQTLDYRAVDWSRVRSAAYLLHQTFCYDYPGPVEDLRQRLVVFPPEHHGGQHLLDRQLEVVGGPPRLQEELDRFGNLISRVYVPRVDRRVEFHVRFLVERHPGSGGVPVEHLREPSFARASALTSPDERLRGIAAELAAGDPATLASRLCTWVRTNLPYKFGVTNVSTSAAQALVLGFGVCQDHAHLMIALARLAGMPARYVSGHLLGEGAMHAWVEVLAPDAQRASGFAVQAWDPSHGRRCRPDYITVAVGRDYADVAPTSGSYTADFPGQLSCSKRAGITRVDYAA